MVQCRHVFAKSVLAYGIAQHLVAIFLGNVPSAAII
jgi:hypothetical protein